MNENINVSIIIPHYNSPQLLIKLLDSIPARGDVQVIVVDDNSTKQCEELDQVKIKYRGRVEFYRNDTGIQSAGSCRNIGLDHAKGKWLLFADADDFFVPGFYEIISKYYDDDADIIYFTPTSIYVDSNLPSDRHKKMAECVVSYLDNPTIENEIKLKFIGYPWSKMIRSQLVIQGNIKFSQVMHWNDMYFSVLSGCKANKIKAVNEIIYCITRSFGSLTTKHNVDAFYIRVNEHVKSCAEIRKSYPPKMCDMARITGLGNVYTALQEHYGIRVARNVALLYKKNGIPIFTVYGLNPINVFKKIKSRIIRRKEEQKYM